MALATALTETDCFPDASQFWLLASHHKTGTELLDSILEAVGWKHCSLPDCDAVQKHCFQVARDSELGPSSLNERGLPRSFTTPNAFPDGKEAFDNFRLDASCLRAMEASRRTAHIRGLRTTTETWPRQLDSYRNASQGAALKALMMVRDPKEIVLSAFFYNAQGGEPAAPRRRQTVQAYHGRAASERVWHGVGALVRL